MQKFIQTYIIFKERVILRIVKLFFHNNLTDSYLILSCKELFINKKTSTPYTEAEVKFHGSTLILSSKLN